MFAKTRTNFESLIRKTLSHEAYPVKLYMHGPVIDLSLYTATHHLNFNNNISRKQENTPIEAIIEAVVHLVLMPGSEELTHVVVLPDEQGELSNGCFEREVREGSSCVFHIVARTHEEFEALVLPNLPAESRPLLSPDSLVLLHSTSRFWHV